MIIDEATIESMVLGGAILGGGGGGAIPDGRRAARHALAIGRPRLVTLDDLSDDATLVTVSAVGAPAARERFVEPRDFVRAVELLREQLQRPIDGLISSENGGAATTNGLVQSAALGIPVVDAPCNGRAHPTGVMGSMALEADPAYLSRQAAVGGDPRAARRVEISVAAPLARADALIRQAAVEAGGMIAVARNPVSARYVREHGAPGAIAMAIRLGRLTIEQQPAGGAGVADRVAAELGGRVIATGEVKGLELETRGGYDVGRLTVGDLELTFWNEYMTAERGGERLATFPDLLVTIDETDGIPRSSAELGPGARLVVVMAPRRALILGAGVKRRDNLLAIERAIGRPIVRHLGQG